MPARYEARKMIRESEFQPPLFGLFDTSTQTFVAFEVFSSFREAISRAATLNHVYARAV